MAVIDLFPSLKRVPQRASPSFISTTMGGLAFLSAGLLTSAAWPLTHAQSTGDVIKCFAIGFGGGLVSYTTTRLAVERGAPLSAMGFTGAKVASIGSMAIVGLGFFAATYAGLTIKKIDELRLREYTRDVAAYVDTRDRRSSEARRAVAAIESIPADLRDKEDCEEKTSCVSGYRHGGRGPVTRALALQRQRAEAVAAQVQEGTEDETNALRDVNQGLATLSKAMDAPNLNKAERRAALQAAGVAINQGLNELDEAIPTTLMAAYADELQRPVTIPSKRESSEAVSRLLSGYGDSLQAVLTSVDDREDKRPAFPAPTGVTDTFAYIGHFLPIAAVVAVIELVFPITLWLYTYFALIAQIHESETATPPARRVVVVLLLQMERESE